MNQFRILSGDHRPAFAEGRLKTSHSLGPGHFGSASRRPFSECLTQSDSATQRTGHRASIYAVDDETDLTELYTTLLAGAGYRVRTFNQRAKALAALKAEVNKPDLLITDYFGPSMHVHRFMVACRVYHPNLRILMASGVSQTDAGFSYMKPDRFIRKPFTPEEFLREVRTALVPQISESY